MCSNQIIQSFWIGDSLSPMELLCINSYLKNGHEFHLYCYNNISNVPKNAIKKDASQIISKENIFVDRFGGFVNLSNQFRYSLLYKLGGWWVDMDTVCLKPFDFRVDFVFSSEYSDPYQRYIVNTTFIKSLPAEKFLLDCLNFIKERGHTHIHWGELGVNLISRMLFRNGLSQYIKPPIVFCPISAYDTKTFVADTHYIPSDQSYSIHWWHEIWRRLNLDKNATFHNRSLYEQMKNKYLIT